ncbi:MAG: effector binding domain-containing protein [Clostridia bacterium]|nr:effector binding domain-containing protein [Clostridia bacterium]
MKNLEYLNQYSYKIVEIEEIQLYSYKINYSETRIIFLNYIRELYKGLKKKNIFNKMMKQGMYGVTIEENGKATYYVGTKERNDNLHKIKIKKGKYAVFDCEGDNQIDIAPLIAYVYKNYSLFMDFKIDLNYCFEYYANNTCYVYIHIIA